MINQSMGSKDWAMLAIPVLSSGVAHSFLSVSP